MTRVVVALLVFLFALPALAQETPAEERSYFINFVENQLSSPNRQIRISGIQGVLSSNATIGEISIADREGVWLRIVNAGIEWQRSALLLGRLEIATLRADAVEVTRRPVPEEGLPALEAQPFRLPDLPLSINLANLDIQRATFGRDVFGLASELRLTGNLRLASGSLHTELDAERLDGPGGKLRLAASFANETEVLDLDLQLSEPENGIVANLLNMEGRPPVDLKLKGSGPLSDLEVGLTLDSAGERLLTGVTRLDRTREGLSFSAELDGPIARLVAPAYRAFFGEDTRLTASGVVRDEGGVRVDSLELGSAALALNASAETSPDGFLTMLRVDASVGNAAGTAVVLPVPGAATTVRNARLQVGFGDDGGENWSGSLDIADFATDTLSIGEIGLQLQGLVQNIDQPQARHITFGVDGDARRLASPREDIAQALGDAISLSIDGEWSAGQPVRLETLRLAGAAFALTAEGLIQDLAYDGRLSLDADSLAPFSGLAGRDLAGAINLAAKGKLLPLSGGFDLALDAKGRELRVGMEAVDNLMAGETTITGGVARGEEGLSAKGLRIANRQFEVTADGTFATGAADFSFDLALSDLSLVAKQAQGRMTATGRATGGDGLINLTLGAAVPTGRLVDKRLSNAELSFDGTLREGNLDGQVAGNAFLDGVRVDLSSGIAVADGERRLSGLSFNAGGAALSGDITQNRQGLLSGAVTLGARDISTAAALFLLEAKGAIDARLAFEAGENQSASVDAKATGLVAGETRVGSATAQARIDDLFGVPMIDGRVEASRVAAAGVEATTVSLRATRQGESTQFAADAALDNGATIATEGSLTPEGEGFRILLDTARLEWQRLAARLTQPASLLVVNQDVTLDTLALDVGGGSIRASGRVAETIDLDVSVVDLPLGIANAVRPDLGLGGTLAGTARVTGPRAQPDVRFDLSGRNVAAAALADVGLGALSVDARGTTSANVLNLDARVGGAGGFGARASGTVGLAAGGALGLDVTLESFPVALVGRMAPGQNPSGNITGRARVTGTTADPRATFDLAGSNLSATALVEAGAAPLSLAASGTYGDGALTLVAAEANGPMGLAATASGHIPFNGPGLAVTANGRIPLQLANRMLADRGTQLTGTALVEARVSGSLAQPVIQGEISASDAAAVDPLTNLRLGSINLSAGIGEQTVTIRLLTASVSGGGTISAGGTVGIDPAAGFPANLNLTLNQARYSDGELVVATVSGGLAVTGGLTRDPLVSGALNIERAEIAVAGGLGGGAAGIDVKHVNPPPQVAATLRRARANDGTPMPTARPSVARLDIRVTATNRIFIRGRGLDAEIGGEVRLTGPVTGIQPVGAFRLIRGRLSILGQRITFDEGTVTLIGDLNPFIDFVARSQGSDITVFITVRGRVSDPTIAFSSQPQLPQDEVLARLIFNRGINELSAFQIAQLAAAAAELAGSGNASLLNSLRGATGLDDLDIVTDSQGNAAVRAGRYIQDNIYLGVEAGAAGTTRGTINLDITQDLKARGAVGSDGETSLGIFFERDY